MTSTASLSMLIVGTAIGCGGRDCKQIQLDTPLSSLGNATSRGAPHFSPVAFDITFRSLSGPALDIACCSMDAMATAASCASVKCDDTTLKDVRDYRLASDYRAATCNLSTNICGVFARNERVVAVFNFCD